MGLPLVGGDLKDFALVLEEHHGGCRLRASPLAPSLPITAGAAAVGHG